MVIMKTTINLDDDLYRRLVKEAVEKYGNTKSF
jgi:predicted CopG family antitoxin